MQELIIKEISELKIGTSRVLDVTTGSGVSTTIMLDTLASGYCSTAALKKGGGDPEVIKLTGAIKKGGFDQEAAVILSRAMVKYSGMLRERGIDTPVVRLSEVYQTSEGSYCIVTSTPYVGPSDLAYCNLEKQIRQAHSFQEIEPYLMKTMKMLNNLFQHQKGLYLEVGIDSKPANFVSDAYGDMWFVDIFPTRFYHPWKNDGEPHLEEPWYINNRLAIVEWPIPQSRLGFELGFWKHFTVHGILTILLSQLSRIRPDLRIDFERLILQNCDGIPELKAYFENAVWRRMRRALHDNDEVAMINIIDSFEGRDIYIMREVATEIALSGRMSPDELEDFYRKSHFEDELPKELVQELKSTLYKKAIQVIDLQ